MRPRHAKIATGLGIGFFLLFAWTCFEARADENLLLLDADGGLVSSYHVGDWTTLVQPPVGDMFEITYETYDAGPTASPETHTDSVPRESAASAVPNALKGTYPAPSALPDVTLYGFDTPIRDFTDPSKPGIIHSPPGGSYEGTIKMTVQASPATAVVEFKYDGEGTWTMTGQNAIILYVHTTKRIDLRAEKDGTYGDVRTVDYEITHPDVPNAEMADTDGDGYPDGWEIANGLNPLEASGRTDTDGDTIPDVEELIRGANPFDPTSFPADSDGDGWYDFDEVEFRETDPNDDQDKPTARRLYEVERILWGLFACGPPEVPACRVGDMDYTITSLRSDILIQARTDGSGHFGGEADQGDRIPVGEAAVIRGVRDSENLVLKRYIPFTNDLSPQQVSGSWTTPEQWRNLYVDMLKANLVEKETGFDVVPSDAYPLCLLERTLEIVAGRPGIYYLVGSGSHPANPNAVRDLEDHLRLRNQDMNACLREAVDILDALQRCEGFLTDLDSVYIGLSAEHEKTVEKQLADFWHQSATGCYVAGLGLVYPYAELSAMGKNLCTILDPGGDWDGDGLENAREVPTALMPTGVTYVASTDSDEDGEPDVSDDCPISYNPLQTDVDGDGIGDACDNDNDNDGLSDGQEAVFGSDPFDADTDDDGQNDYEEYMAYEDPGVVVTIDPLVSPVNRTGVTITGTRESGAAIAVTVDTGAAAGVVSYPDATTWECTITGLSEGSNEITATAADGVGGSGQDTETIVVDTVAPTVVISSPTAGPTGNNTPLLSYTVDEGDEVVTVDTVIVEKVSGDNLDVLTDGEHTVRVTSTDIAGNTGFDAVTFTVVTTYTNVINVSAGSSVQTAIDGADHGDRIVVAGGSYRESIDFKGKAIMLVSSEGPEVTVIDGNDAGSVIVFDSDESALSIIDGFTIQNGRAEQGGGIYCGNGSPVIRNCWVIDNQATVGSDGGGIYCGHDTAPVIVNNIIAHNEASDKGGGIAVSAGAGPVINNNTIDDNDASMGGGIYCGSDSWPEIVNNIITNSGSGDGIWAEADADAIIDYNDVWNNSRQNYNPGTSAGTHDICDAPAYIDASVDAYRLLAGSPCIDVGDDGVLWVPDVDQDGKPRWLDGDGDGVVTIDLGPYEFGDLCERDENDDFDVDGSDLAEVAYRMAQGDYGADDLSAFAPDFGRTNCP